MNTVVTSKEDILKASRELIRKQVCSVINIRSVAAACGVSVGSIYNYFDSKAELVGATIESIWCEIFQCTKDSEVFKDTQAYITWIYSQIEYGSKQYPGFFTFHSLSFAREDKSDAKRRMQRVWQHIMDRLCYVLKQDKRIRSDAFTEQFTVEKFADVLFSLILSALLKKDYNPTSVLEIISRTLY